MVLFLGLLQYAHQSTVFAFLSCWRAIIALPNSIIIKVKPTPVLVEYSTERQYKRVSPWPVACIWSGQEEVRGKHYSVVYFLAGVCGVGASIFPYDSPRPRLRSRIRRPFRSTSDYPPFTLNCIRARSLPVASTTVAHVTSHRVGTQQQYVALSSYVRLSLFEKSQRRVDWIFSSREHGLSRGAKVGHLMKRSRTPLR